MDTSKWLDEIDKITVQFNEAFGDLTDDELHFKPDEESWSIAQNMDHLITTNESYYPVIEAAKNGDYKAPFIGKIGLFPNVLGYLMLKVVQPHSKKKIKTFTTWKPTGNYPDILKAFSEHQAGLKKKIEDSKELLAKNTVISSPASKYIVYKLDKAFDIIVAHEKRHFEQANDVLQKLNEA